MLYVSGYQDMDGQGGQEDPCITPALLDWNMFTIGFAITTNKIVSANKLKKDKEK